jgi:hypothetical protein
MLLMPYAHGHGPDCSFFGRVCEKKPASEAKFTAIFLAPALRKVRASQRYDGFVVKDVKALYNIFGYCCQHHAASLNY